jgi:hypothetical protein
MRQETEVRIAPQRRKERRENQMKNNYPYIIKGMKIKSVE